ncbi:TatD family hydrolase [Spongiibacter sp. KMU-166]|uniref:TatD family hydrolase n=1 Tax=Spongiibacter thalassae TaxID=2721624 RepID=A0ABX1GI60_9GAMM|nr:Qat anti-phage system TatD family nuclease QatD [Spongiibacter thalassae]NKI18586.1 TatD family hydrolase [Spongiibacter thalassae]
MDFHCHLDLYPDARNVYAEASDRVEFVWLVTTSPRAFAATSKVLLASEKIFISPGLHPEVAGKRSGELEMLLSQMEQYSGVGEVGLDGSSRYKQHFELQKNIFQSVLQKSVNLGGRVLSIHSRSAAKDVLCLLESHPGYGTAVLHWFTDSPSQLSRAKEMGCWFSVGPAMVASANGRKLASLMPRDRVVPESDGPFAKVRGASVMPWEAASVASTLSEIWSIPVEEVVLLLRDNGSRLTQVLAEGKSGR